MTTTDTDLDITDLLIIGGGMNGCGITRNAADRGLRYLEFFEIALVRHALAEREVLLRMMPHISWMIRFELFLYDNLGGRKILPGTTTLDFRNHIEGTPLKARFEKAFEYSDCLVEDSRLVVLNAQDTQARGRILGLAPKWCQPRELTIFGL